MGNKIRIIKLKSSMGCEYPVKGNKPFPFCGNEAIYEIDNNGNKHVYCKLHSKKVLKSTNLVDEPFFDGGGFFGKPKINLLEKILYMPIFLIVIAIRWWLKRRRK